MDQLAALVKKYLAKDVNSIFLSTSKREMEI
jgi:hypothetical protein